jgi:hypothetical protein
MKRENLHAAERIIKTLEHLEHVDRVVEVANKNKFLGYSGIAVRLTEDLEYMFPDNIEFSMFYNILKSSIEGEIEKLNKQLEVL